MPSIKEYDHKLASLKNTHKMTRTMKLVSMSKLYRAQENQRQAQLYADELTALISRVAASLKDASHPLMQPHKTVERVLLVVFTSDKGLCASFNNGLIRSVETWLRDNQARYKEIKLSFCGKKGYQALSKHCTVQDYYRDAAASPVFSQAVTIGRDLAGHFLSGRFDEIVLFYNRYHSPLSQTPVVEKLLPIEPQDVIHEEQKFTSEYIFEPKEKELLTFLVPKFLFFKIYYTLLENAAGEHGARMTAMDSATKNAQDLIARNTLLRNRARQAAITTELIEIVSGAEALKS